MIPGRLFTNSLLFAVFLTGCTTGQQDTPTAEPPAVASAAPPAATDLETDIATLETVLTAIDQLYIREHPLPPLVAAGFRAVLQTKGTTHPLSPPPDATPGTWAQEIARELRSLDAHGLITPSAEGRSPVDLFLLAVTGSLDVGTRYVPPRLAEDYQQAREDPADIGADFARRKDGSTLQITEIRPIGPAAQAGLQVGDILTAIDSIKVSRLDPADIEALVSGEPMTQVRLDLMRGAKPFTVTLRRVSLAPPTVVASRLRDTLVLQISGFNRHTPIDAHREIRRILTAPGAPIRGLLLDLRGNHGGLLKETLQVADLFLDRGPLAIVRGRHPDSHIHHQAEPGSIATGMPLAVLIDGQTASSAEALTAALADRGRAISLGGISYGKGSVQTLISLPNGGELALTWATIVTPSGRIYDGRGLHPMICLGTGENGDLAAQREQDLAARRDWLALTPEDQEAFATLKTRCTPRPGADILEEAVGVVENRRLMTQMAPK
ncbi:MAG: S41 family peptidase [Magnetospiraceae bacterium]